MRAKATLVVFALLACLASGLISAGPGGAAGTGNPSATFLASGNPVQFQNPIFTSPAGDSAAPWLVGWDPNKASPDQLPPIQGRVTTMTRVGDYVYLAGMFHRALAPDGTYDETVRHLVRVRWDTGRLDTAWKPQLRGSGTFGEATPWNFASFDPGDGVTPSPGWWSSAISPRSTGIRPMPGISRSSSCTTRIRRGSTPP
jgi:hypothetical protein